MWLGLQNGPDGGLARWNRSTGDLHVFTAAEGYPEAFLPTAFVEDAAGALWIGNYLGGLARVQNGRFSNWTEREGAPSGMVTQLLRDHLNRLWMATSRNGITRVDITGDRPTFTSYTRANRLTSNDVRCVVEDAEGRLYLGTGRGIDRLDPATGNSSVPFWPCAARSDVRAVFTTIPSCAVRVHPVWSFGIPSTSTRHMRQAPTAGPSRGS